MAGKSGWRICLLALLCAASAQVHAGLFDDDGARFQIRQLEDRVAAAERANTQQADANRQMAETVKQQTRSLLDLQTQIEAQGTELRTLRGQNEELSHKLLDTEKRQKDFYIDLDSRLRHFETQETAAPPVAQQGQEDSVMAENRAYEAAYTLLKAGKQQNAIASFLAFLKRYPESVYVPNAHFALGNAYLALKDYKNALPSYQTVVSKYAFSTRTPDALLGVADSQVGLTDLEAADKTLEIIIAKYPSSEAANGAKRRLAAVK